MATTFRNIEIEFACDKFPTLTPSECKRICDELKRDGQITHYGICLHDKDTKDDGTPKTPHIHIEIERKGKSPAVAERLANWFGVLPQNVQKCHKFESAMAYLIHANAPQKWQYKADEVLSDFTLSEYESLLKRVSDASNAESVDEIIEKIVSGEYREYNYAEHIPPVMWCKNKKIFQNAFQTRSDMLAYKKKGDRKMKCIFISGESGTGKTTLAKQFATLKGYSFFVSSSGEHLLDDYKGQDCIILDDIRPSSLKLNDFLKLTDNHTECTVACRYWNKNISECKLIIATSVMKINDFYENLQRDSDYDPLQQICRRFTEIWQIDARNIAAFKYNPNEEGFYSFKGSMANPIQFLFDSDAVDEALQAESLAEVFHVQLVKNPTREELSEDIRSTAKPCKAPNTSVYSEEEIAELLTKGDLL